MSNYFQSHFRYLTHGKRKATDMGKMSDALSGSLYGRQQTGVVAIPGPPPQRSAEPTPDGVIRHVNCHLTVPGVTGASTPHAQQSTLQLPSSQVVQQVCVTSSTPGNAGAPALSFHFGGHFENCTFNLK